MQWCNIVTMSPCLVCAAEYCLVWARCWLLLHHNTQYNIYNIYNIYTTPRYQQPRCPPLKHLILNAGALWRYIGITSPKIYLLLHITTCWVPIVWWCFNLGELCTARLPPCVSVAPSNKYFAGQGYITYGSMSQEIIVKYFYSFCIR